MSEAHFISLTLLTRATCALCDHLVLALELMRTRFRFEYTKVDVDSDPVLCKRFGLRVPILLDGDTEICAGTCDPTAVVAYLTAIQDK